MSNMEHRGVRQGEWLLVAVGLGLLATLLVGCSRGDGVEVSAGGIPPVPSTTAPAVPGEKFQGSVASVDVNREEFVVAVEIVWTPVLKATQEDRPVTVDAQTRWATGAGGLAELRAGEAVQVEAVSLPDGTWRARQVQLFDVD